MASEMKRAFCIVLDGVGIGSLPDAAAYGDDGSDTLGHIARHVNGLKLPTLESLGLGNIRALRGVAPQESALGCYGKMAELSAGKDSTTGHWEIAGIRLDKPFPTYPNGFPREVIASFEEQTGRKTLGNKAASGTDIIRELGEAHIASGDLIVYTSADSVFQIAAHTDVVPLEELYRFCRIAREILQGEHAVARVIARPFSGKNVNDFSRTKDRKDFSVKPFSETVHAALLSAGIHTVGIGKVNDLYACYGITESHYTKTNAEGMQALEDALDLEKQSFVMANLVDFDTLYGHRNDPDGFYAALREFDGWLPRFLKRMQNNDLLIIIADHGNDPLFPGTDHTREYVPLLAYGLSLRNNQDLGSRKTFSDINATLRDYFNVSRGSTGSSFLDQLKK